MNIPCPFCGSHSLDPATQGKRYVSCNDCGCFGPGPEQKGILGAMTQWAIAEAEINDGWNRRASTPSALPVEGAAIAALRYYRDECTGAEPSLSVFERMVDEAIVGTPSKEAQAAYFEASQAIAEEGAAQVEAAGYFLRDGWSRDGETKEWMQVGDEFKNDADVVPLYTAPPASPSEGGPTDEQIDAAWNEHARTRALWNVREFAREILALSPSMGEAVDAAMPEISAYCIPVSSKRFASEVYVQRARQIVGPDLWAARLNGDCLNKAGAWEWEPMPSSRDDEFLARCRFASAEEAIAAVRTAIQSQGTQP